MAKEAGVVKEAEVVLEVAKVGFYLRSRSKNGSSSDLVTKVEEHRVVEPPSRYPSGGKPQQARVPRLPMVVEAEKLQPFLRARFFQAVVWEVDLAAKCLAAGD